MFIQLLVIITFLLVIDYVVFIYKISTDWEKKNEAEILVTNNLPFLSIVIAARNEELRITKCLENITANDYPIDKYEIIVIDDHSEDETYSLLNTSNIPNLRIFPLENFLIEGERIISYKKKALELGVKMAYGDYILFTDADVIVPKTWIGTMLLYITQYQKKIVTGPIQYESDGSFLQDFQALDVAGTMVWTASGIWSQKTYLANGANMIVEKSAYFEFYDQAGQNQVSGDDVFLIQSIALENPNDVDFIKSRRVLVTTFPETSWKNLLGQRLRWASKTNSYPNGAIKRRVIFLFFFYLFLVFAIFWSIALENNYLGLTLSIIFMKTLVELFLFRKAQNISKPSLITRALPLYSITQMLFFLVVASYSMVKSSINWKERIIKA